MTLTEQIEEAIRVLNGLFERTEPIPPIPEDATLESLWAQLHANQIKMKPGVEASVKLLLENVDLASIPIGLLAEIIREVFTQHGFSCKCSESSVRWYQSQRCLVWNIVRRKPVSLT
jgi:hypothetical protein